MTTNILNMGINRGGQAFLILLQGISRDSQADVLDTDSKLSRILGWTKLFNNKRIRDQCMFAVLHLSYNLCCLLIPK